MSILKPLAQLNFFGAVWLFVLATPKHYEFLLLAFVFMLLALLPAPEVRKNRPIVFNLEFYISNSEDIAEIEKKVRDVVKTLPALEVQKED